LTPKQIAKRKYETQRKERYKKYRVLAKKLADEEEKREKTGAKNDTVIAQLTLEIDRDYFKEKAALEKKKQSQQKNGSQNE
jgi:hypothetical protein